MKVLIINGSPRKNGNSSIVAEELVKQFKQEGVETEVYEVGSKDIPGCKACGYCKIKGECVYKDDVNELAKSFKEANGLIVISPVYYASPNGSVISLLDRLFQSSAIDKRFKVGASFAIARRAGTSTSFDVLNKYFTIAGMPVVSGDYWNNVFGRTPGEASQDEEGMRNARIIAKRMSFLMKAIEDGLKKYPDALDEEPRVATHFIK